MNTFTIIEPISDSDLKEYYRIRYEVLRKPWNQPENTTKDDTESTSTHILVKSNDGNAIATGRMQYNSTEEAQIRSMAVIDSYRGKGIGSQMISYLEVVAKKKNIKTILLDAREKAVDFYLQNGYEIVGPSYLLFGEIKHFRMKKSIDQ